MREALPLAHVRDWLQSLTEEEGRDWQDEELRHIVRGYAFALDAAGIPFDRQRAELSRMLKATRRFENLEEGKDRVVHGTIDGGYTLHEPEGPRRIYDKIQLRADEPHYLGYAAAHEGMHWLKGASEATPIEVSTSYRLSFPIRDANVSKKRRWELNKKTRTADASLNDEHRKVIHAAQISAAVADSLRARLGKSVAQAFLEKTRSGMHPYTAYVSLEVKNRRTKRELPGK